MGITPKEFQDILQGNPDITVVGGDDSPPQRRAALPAVAPVPTEHDEQCYLFAWAAANEAKHPELALLHATPNGGLRHPAVAAMLKAEGVKAGYPDISLPVARGKKWHSLVIELKRADRSNRPTPEQLLWIERLREYGNCAVCCYGAQEAINAITAYLGQEG